MRVAVIGTGYVGLVTGACLADTGLTVCCVDVDEAKTARLRNGEMPFYEPGLSELVLQLAEKGRLTFTTQLREALDGAELAFIAVGTPSGGDGAADLSQVLAVGRAVGELLAQRVTNHLVVVTKSTVPVGTSKKLQAEIANTIAAQRSRELEPATFDVASNPEFLKEGTAIDDFANPDRIVIGVDSPTAKAALERVYRPFVLNGKPVLFMDVASAEIAKYAANAMLATRISFMNAIASLCDATGGDVAAVRSAVGTDPRIGSSFLYAGPGYGGSCFPKDVRALASIADEHGIDFTLLRGVESINNSQPLVVLEKLRAHIGDLANKHIAVWGIAFKPKTDDTRDAPSLTIFRALQAAGATVAAYDPIAHLPPGFETVVRQDKDPYECVTNADALVVVTEWSEFRNPDVARLQELMRGRTIIDARNVLDATHLSSNGFTVARIGRATVVAE